MMDQFSAIFDNLAAKMEQAAAPEHAEDFRDETGHLICGLCLTRKQTTVIDPLGNERRVNCLCRCEADRRETERLRKIEREKIEELRKNGIHDSTVDSWTFENDDGTNPKMETARKYVKNWPEMLSENIGLLIYGTVGTGKTYMAASIANALLDNCVSVLVTSFPRLINKLGRFDGDNNAFLKSLNRYKLIVIDDLGVERQSDFVMEQVYGIIDERYKSGKPMIITTNIPIEEIRNPKDVRYSRIYDRILENCIPVQVTGESRRAALHAQKMKKAIDIFKD